MVNIKILLSKQTRYGVSGPKKQWFEHYLTGYTRSVSVAGQLSETLPFTIGVLQGPIVGPLLLCLLHLNDLLCAIGCCSVSLFANYTETGNAQVTKVN